MLRSLSIICPPETLYILLKEGNFDIYRLAAVKKLNQSIDQSIDQSINRSKNRSIKNQSINRSIAQTSTQIFDELINQSIDRSIDWKSVMIEFEFRKFRIKLIKHGEGVLIINTERGNSTANRIFVKKTGKNRRNVSRVLSLFVFFLIWLNGQGQLIAGRRWSASPRFAQRRGNEGACGLRGLVLLVRRAQLGIHLHQIHGAESTCNRHKKKKKKNSAW